MTAVLGAGGDAYDRVLYRGVSAPAADCRRLETVARLAGLPATRPATARVLELGCGAGANLVPLALEHPHATIVGCDLSARAVASARGDVERLGLANVTLRHVDLRDVDDSWGRFDYIVCHDVFSWVEPDARQRILDILRRQLAPHGVGFVSFDALPGWQLHRITRDLMRHHAAAVADPREAVAQARAVLAMAAAAQDQRDDPYASLLREDYFSFSRMGDDQLFHLTFSADHQPLYLHEFIGLIAAAGLQFVGDSHVPPGPRGRQPESLRAFLDRLPPPQRLQYMDFFDNRTFRGALVCHREVELGDAPDEGALRDAWLGLATAAPPVETADPAIQGMLGRLAERRPEFVPFAELSDGGTVAPGRFLDAYAAGIIEVALSPPRVTSRIGERPAVSPLVRLQAEDGVTVTNQRFEPVRLTDIARHVVRLLDGSHGRDQVSASVARAIQSGTTAIDPTYSLTGDPADAGWLTNVILRQLRDRALLVG